MTALYDVACCYELQVTMWIGWWLLALAILLIVLRIAFHRTYYRGWLGHAAWGMRQREKAQKVAEALNEFRQSRTTDSDV